MALSYGFCLDAPETTYNSEEFAEAFHAVFGSGVCTYGAQFSISSVRDFTVTIGMGYALCRGRWIKSDELEALTFQPAGNYEDRYDAVAIRVDYSARKVFLEVLSDIDPDNPPRNSDEYTIYLYLVRIARGETVLEESNFIDVRGNADLCGYITPLSVISNDAEYVYRFLDSGIDQEVARLLGLSQAIVNKAADAIQKINEKIVLTKGTSIGDITVTLSRPIPNNEYLLCDGSAIPEQYPDLSAMLDGALPQLSYEDDRYQYWIYAGAPVM